MKLLVMLAAGLIAAGCARESDIPVDLPVARHAPDCVDPDPRTITVVMTTDGVIRVNKRTVTLDELRAEIEQSKPVEPEVPVAIRADRAISFTNLWPVIEAVSGNESHRLLRVQVRQGGAESRSEIEFCKTRCGADGNRFERLVIMRRNHEISLNDKVCNEEQCERLLVKLKTLDASLAIYLSPDDSESVQDMVDLMDLCLKAGLRNLYLGLPDPVPINID